jgi:Zn-dependent peptidase ImmA (M78 family)
VSKYDQVKQLASAKRALYEVSTATLNLNVVRRIYAAEKIKIDKWDFKPSIRAVYMCDDGDASVAINKSLPREPYMFSLVHELKHHYMDGLLIQGGELKCGDYNTNEQIEKAAEVFAAEFIYPELEFLECVASVGIAMGKCTPEDVVRLKRACGACVSYQFLRKRLVRLGFGSSAELDKVQFQKLEDEIYGVPIYKRSWFKAYRKTKAPSTSHF